MNLREKNKELESANEELRREVERLKGLLCTRCIEDNQQQIADLKEKLETATHFLGKVGDRAEEAEARLKPIEQVCDKMGKFLMKQTDACQNDADCVCPEMNDLIDEWQAIKAVGTNP